MTPRRAAPVAFRPTWCLICCARGHGEADCTADIPKGEEPCFFCRKIGHDIKKCPSKDALGFETWDPNAPGDENAMPTPFHRANSAARARFNEKKKREHWRLFQRHHEGPARRRVPRERRPRLPGLRVRPALSRPDGTIPPLPLGRAWPPAARDTSVDARGNLGLPCTTASPKTSPRRTRASSTFRLGGERCYASTSIPLGQFDGKSAKPFCPH